LASLAWWWDLWDASEAEKNGLEWDWEITDLELRTDRPAAEFMFVPALTLLGLLGWWQRRRRKHGSGVSAA